MSNVEQKHYGQFSSEKEARENETCRQIVSEISNFGVTERQRLMIIYLLSLELENVEHMKALTMLARDLGNKDLFLIDREDDSVSNNTQ